MCELNSLFNFNNEQYVLVLFKLYRHRIHLAFLRILSSNNLMQDLNSMFHNQGVYLDNLLNLTTLRFFYVYL